MRPVDQTVTKPPYGNCFAACVASILEVSITDVPSFFDERWWDEWEEWLGRFGYELWCIPAGDSVNRAPKGYSILSGNSFSGPWLHAVVALDGHVVHDPNPARLGVRDCVDYVVIAPRGTQNLDEVPCARPRLMPEAA